MKRKILAVAFAAAAAIASLPAHAGALAASNLDISSLGLINVSAGGVPVDPSWITITSELRTGNASATYNNVVSADAGVSVTVGGTVDVSYRCVGACGAGTAALYGGNLENNSNTHLAPAPTENFALGDMRVSGSALSGVAAGLTRADALTTGSPNNGGSNATIFNGAGISATFTANQTFTGFVTMFADAYLRAWVNPDPQNAATAGAGMNFVLQITSSDDANFAGNPLVFSPSELNKAFTSDDVGDNAGNNFSFNGFLSSLSRTFTGGKTYNLSINQSSNATVVEIPEPTTLALVGGALLALAGLARRRKTK